MAAVMLAAACDAPAPVGEAPPEVETAQPEAIPVEHLVIVIDREHSLRVSTSVKSDSVRDFAFGEDRSWLDTFSAIDEPALGRLTAAAFRANPDTPVTLWSDPNAKPMGWPAGFTPDADLIDSGVYLNILVERARAHAGIPDTASPWRAGTISLPFPPAVPMKVGSHAQSLSRSGAQ